MTPEQLRELGRLLSNVVAHIGMLCHMGDGGIDMLKTALGEVASFVSSLTAPPWTGEAPTVAGWYWWREDESDEWLPWEVFPVEETECWALYMHTEAGTMCPVSTVGGQWSGPLPEPGEE